MATPGALQAIEEMEAEVQIDIRPALTSLPLTILL